MILRSVKHMTSKERKDYHRKFMPTFLNKELGLEGGGGGGVGVVLSIGSGYSLLYKNGMCFS